MDAHDLGLQGLLEVANELFNDWTWACAVDDDGGRRIIEARPLEPAPRAAIERWAVELLGDTAAGALQALEQATESRELAIRAFVVEDPLGRSVAVMGFGPPEGVSPEGDVILDAVARNLGLFGGPEAQPATG